jgi:hypothetical protein
VHIRLTGMEWCAGVGGAQAPDASSGMSSGLCCWLHSNGVLMYLKFICRRMLEQGSVIEMILPFASGYSVCDFGLELSLLVFTYVGSYGLYVQSKKRHRLAKRRRKEQRAAGATGGGKSAAVVETQEDEDDDEDESVREESSQSVSTRVRRTGDDEVSADAVTTAAEWEARTKAVDEDQTEARAWGFMGVPFDLCAPPPPEMLEEEEEEEEEEKEKKWNGENETTSGESDIWRLR